MRNLLTDKNKQRSKEELHRELLEKKKMEVLHEFMEKHKDSAAG